MNSVRLASINEVPPGHNTNPPVLIHCNEGGGKSGVMLASDLLLYTLDHNQVKLMRFQKHFFFFLHFLLSSPTGNLYFSAVAKRKGIST